MNISIQVPFALSEETVDTSEVLYFLENVANVDVSKYKPNLVVTTSENWPELGGLSHVTGKYALESKDSTLNVLFMFTDNTLCYCAITLKARFTSSKSYPLTLRVKPMDSFKDTRHTQRIQPHKQ